MTSELRTPVNVARVLLTLVGAILFFGPMARDANASHLLNPTWVGHARFHFMWSLGSLFCTGILAMYVLWVRRPLTLTGLYLVGALEAASLLGGFWFAAALVDVYGGVIRDAEVHMTIAGINENVAIFGSLAIILVGTLVFVRGWIAPRMGAAGG